MISASVALPARHKWVRFFRLQYAVAMTPKNLILARQGKPLRGRPRPRLVSFDPDDLFIVDERTSLADIKALSVVQSVPYYMVRFDNAWYALQDDKVVLWCIDMRRIAILTEAELRGML